MSVARIVAGLSHDQRREFHGHCSLAEVQLHGRYGKKALLDVQRQYIAECCKANTVPTLARLRELGTR